jgi:hypothetical protein
VKRRHLSIVRMRDDGAAVRPVDWARWIFVGGVAIAAVIAWLVRHAR